MVELMRSGRAAKRILGSALLLVILSLLGIRQETKGFADFSLLTTENFAVNFTTNAYQLYDSWTTSNEDNIDATTASHDKEEAFAGCLLVLDENFRLPEWIAYHYHVLPLRYLVVAVDPRSRFSPEPIMQLFRDQLNMTIVTWNDTDFGDWDPEPKDPNSWSELRGRFLLRQTTFLRKCMQHLYEHDQSWTILWDTDEYLVFTEYNRTRNSSETGRLGTSPASLHEPGTALRYIQNVGVNACFPLFRTLVGAKETDAAIWATETFPSVVNDSRRLETIRFRYRNEFDVKLNAQPKSMVNVRYVNHSFRVKSPHYPAPYLSCPGALKTKDSSMQLYHYISSWEAYSFRDDSRKGRERSIEAYMDRSEVASKFYDDSSTSWLSGFVDDVGEDTARILLQDAGLPMEYNASDKISLFRCIVGKQCAPGGTVPPPLQF